MAYCTTNCCEETAESKLLRKKDREIEILKDVITEQAKGLVDAKISYEEIVDRNQELRDTVARLRHEKSDTFEKVFEIKDLLKLAKECADDTTKSQHQREVSEIRVELLNDVLDILEGNESEEKVGMINEIRR